MELSVSKRQRQTARIIQRRRQALDLYIQGKTFTAIGCELGICRRQANRDITAVLEEEWVALRTRAHEYLAIQYERLEMAVPGLVEQVKAGDPKAIETWIKLSESTRKLLGLDAPARAEVTNTQPIQIMTVEPPLLIEGEVE